MRPHDNERHRPHGESRRSESPILRRLIGASGLLLVLAGMLVLLLSPGELGAIRGAGVSLAWWYGGVVGELLGLAVTLLALKASDRAS